jgi:hypothetical protein
MPNQLIELPEPASDVPGLPVIGDVLGMLRLTGAIVLRAEFSHPWAYESPWALELSRILALGAERLVLFHIVAEGTCIVRLESGLEAVAGPGDVIMLPYGDRHLMGTGELADPATAATLMRPPPWSTFPVLRWGGGGMPTTLVCGYLRCDDSLFDPVVRALPSLFTVTPPSGPPAAWVAASIQYALQATGQPLPSEGGLGLRLSELVLTEVLRLYLRSRPRDVGGLFAAVQDPHVGRALAVVHAAPARRWTVGERPARRPARAPPWISGSGACSAAPRCGTWPSGACGWPRPCCATRRSGWPRSPTAWATNRRRRSTGPSSGRGACPPARWRERA